MAASAHHEECLALLISWGIIDPLYVEWASDGTTVAEELVRVVGGLLYICRETEMYISFFTTLTSSLNKIIFSWIDISSCELDAALKANAYACIHLFRQIQKALL